MNFFNYLTSTVCATPHKAFSRLIVFRRLMENFVPTGMYNGGCMARLLIKCLVNLPISIAILVHSPKSF